MLGPAPMLSGSHSQLELCPTREAWGPEEHWSSSTESFRLARIGEGRSDAHLALGVHARGSAGVAGVEEADLTEDLPGDEAEEHLWRAASRRQTQVSARSFRIRNSSLTRALELFC